MLTHGHDRIHGWAVQEQRCRKKTARGNVYDDEREAWRVADIMTYRHGDQIVAFRCLFCGLWHVGKRRKDGG